MNRAPGMRAPQTPHDGAVSRRLYLTVQAMIAGATWQGAMEAVASVAIEHGWDMDERRTWDDWDRMHR